ncbi:MAG: nucleoside phosphorylase [Thermoplasmata archaeon]
MPKQLITTLDEGDVAKYVLISGEPERIPKIAAALKNPKKKICVREYAVYEGTLEGKRVTVASTGIGGPSTAILIEELANLGADTFVRIGTSGGIADDLEKGDFVISTAAIRADGTSRSYVWPEYPASANHEVTLALIKAAVKSRAKFTVGVTFSVDGFYSENKVLGKNNNLVSMSHGGYMLREMESRLRDVKMMGAKNIEMENATLFTLGNLFGLRTGAICIVSDVVPWHPTEKIIDFEKNMSKCIQVGVEGIRTLIRWDRQKGRARYWIPR